MDWFAPAVVVVRSALNVMAAEAAASADGRETGGFLFGLEERKLGQRRAVIVRHAGGPGPAADRRATFFRPDVAHAQQLALDAFTADGSQWIGAWHTHLQWRGNRLSSADLRTYRSHLADDALGFSQFLSIVLTPTVRIWPPALSWDRLHCRPWLVSPGRVVTADLVIAERDPTR